MEVNNNFPLYFIDKRSAAVERNPANGKRELSGIDLTL